MRSFRDLIALWPTRVVFAREMGLDYEAAAGMYGRAFIHPHYWPTLLEAAHRRGINITPEDLMRFSDRRRRRRRRKKKTAESAAIAA